MIFDTMFMVPATMGMTGLFCYQMYLVKANTTSIETFEVELDQRDTPGASKVRCGCVCTTERSAWLTLRSHIGGCSIEGLGRTCKKS